MDDRQKREKNRLVYRIQRKNKYVALDCGSILSIFIISFFFNLETNDFDEMKKSQMLDEE